MEIKKKVELAPLTTLKIGGPAEYFVEVSKTSELVEAVHFAKENNLPVFVLGGGSNILVSDDGFPGLVIHLKSLGKEVVEETGEHIFMRIAAGEVLDEIIAWTVGNGWWGMENLSLIPGLVGALVIQNVNAYGAKAEHIVEEVEVFDLNDLSVKKLSNADCRFAYRASIFNTVDKGRYVVTSALLKLSRVARPNIKYPDLEKHFAENGEPTISKIREAVISIRKRKGYDPIEHLTVGSFFSNLLLSRQQFEELGKRIENDFGKEKAALLLEMRNKFSEKNEIKIPAGFILDVVLGLRGFEMGKVRLSPLHVQSLENMGGAKAVDVVALYSFVKNMAFEKLGVVLKNEPEFVGFE